MPGNWGVSVSVSRDLANVPCPCGRGECHVQENLAESLQTLLEHALVIRRRVLGDLDMRVAALELLLADDDVADDL